MVTEIDLDKVEFDEQPDLRPEEFKPAIDQKTVLPGLLVKAGVAKTEKTANKYLIAASIFFFGLSLIMFIIASTIYVNTDSNRSTLVNDYIFNNK